MVNLIKLLLKDIKNNFKKPSKIYIYFYFYKIVFSITQLEE